MHRSKCLTGLSLGFLLLAVAGQAAQEDAKQRVKAVRDLGKGGSEEISRIEPFLTDPDLDVRLEAVKAIADIGTQNSLTPLIKATSDNDRGSTDTRHRRPGELLCARLREDRPHGSTSADGDVH